MAEGKLRFGLAEVVPPDAVAAWGGRFIDYGDHVDLPPNRTDVIGDPDALAALDERLPLERLSEAVARLERGPTVWTVFDDERVCVRARRGGGYVYVAAWVKPERARVPLGWKVATAGVVEWMFDDAERMAWVSTVLTRHAGGDWGDVDAEDARANDEALRDGGRLLSAWRLPEHARGSAPDDRLWVLTEADRSVTTLMWPSDY